MKLPTYQVSIVVGMKEGYDGIIRPYKDAYKIIEKFCDNNLVGAEVIEGQCYYVNGHEPCIRVNFINYPRFPKTNEEVYQKAKDLGMILAKALNQQRFTIVATDLTELIEL